MFHFIFFTLVSENRTTFSITNTQSITMKFTCLLLSLFTVLNSFSQSSTYEQSRKSYDEGDYKKSIELASKLIESNTNDCKAYALRGSSYKELDELALAMNDLLIAVKCDSTQADAFGQLAHVYSLYGDIETAILTYTKAISLDKTDGENYLDRGLCKKELARYDEAVSDLLISISLDSTIQDAYGILGEVYLRTAKYEEAFKAFNKSISISPNALNITLSGVAQANLGNFNEAIDLFTKALKYDDVPKSSIYIYRGEIYVRLLKKEEACSDFENAYKLGDIEGRELQKKHCQ